MKPVRIEIYPSGDEWRWRTRCPENGNVLTMSSEGYANRCDAVSIIRRHHGSARIRDVAA